MSINLLPPGVDLDRAISLKAAAQFLPEVSQVTLWRWCMRGVSGIRLEHTRMGHRILTTPRAINEFCEKTAEARLEALDGRRDRRPKPKKTPPAARRRSIENARRLLAEDGIRCAT